MVPTYAVPLKRMSPPGWNRRAGSTTSPPAGSGPDQPLHGAHCTGEMFDVIVNGVGGRRCPSAAFRPDDPDLTGYLTFDFAAFEWNEEDEPIVAHPHDPFKRIDILASTRHVRLEREGRLLAESSRPLLLFETSLPVRFYLPRADVVVDLEPSDTVSYCAYKGRASYSLGARRACGCRVDVSPATPRSRTRHRTRSRFSTSGSTSSSMANANNDPRPRCRTDRSGYRASQEGKLADITGPGITDRWGVTCTDLGASIVAPNGTLVSVFGDTFSGNRVGQGDWRSPVILIGTGDATSPDQLPPRRWRRS